MKEFLRNCPNCNKKIIYKSQYYCDGAENKGTFCQSCRSKKNWLDENYKKTISEKTKKFHTGKKWSIEINAKKANRGLKNGMAGKNIYSVWLKKYGKEEANRRMKLKQQKTSVSLSGSNNPMYGKPSPQGSGNGWSGWYKDWYFRSIAELSYMINVIERFNLEWKKAECKELMITYKNYDNSERTYFPDFLIANKYLVEIKPKKLHSSSLVQLKSEAAKKFCKENNFIYKLRSVRYLTKDELKNLHDTQKIKFIKRYEEKYVNQKFF